MTDTWRLIITPPARGAWNMAVDEAILEAVGRNESPPTLRLYAWEPPCLSLGYAQPFSDVDQALLAMRTWDVVRRPTGGRAILHADELTYAVVASWREPRLAGSVLESYNRLARALLVALRSLDLPVDIKEHSRSKLVENPTPVCFEVPSAYEITVGGKKLIGSAQARRKHGVLQHGSLPLRGDLARITQVLSFPDEAARALAAERLLGRATTVETILGRIVTWEQAAQAFVSAFRGVLALEFQPGELSLHENSRAAVLTREKYAHGTWTSRV